MSGLGRLLGLLALDAASTDAEREAAWRDLHRRPDAPPLADERRLPIGRPSPERRQWGIGFRLVALVTRHARR